MEEIQVRNLTAERFEEERKRIFIRQLNRHIKEMRLKSAHLVQWTLRDWLGYIGTVVILFFLQMALLVLMLLWLCWYRGGFTFDLTKDPEKFFNWHPLLMIGGMVLCSGLSITLFRCCRCVGEDFVEVLHVALHTCALPCLCYGIAIAWMTQNLISSAMPTNSRHFYSLHSWLGLITVTLYIIQLMVAFVCAILIRFKCHWLVQRSKMLKGTHMTFGLMCFLFSITTAITGMMEKQHQLKLHTVQGSTLDSSEHHLIMAICLTLLLFAVVVALCVRKSTTPTQVKFHIRNF